MAAHIEALEKQMIAAASDLDFEEAARLRDEMRRLQEVELAVADDPLARNVGIENTKSSRAQTAKRGKAGARASDNTDKNKSLFKKNDLDEMTVGRTEKPATPEGWSEPRKSYGEEMRGAKGTNNDVGTPADKTDTPKRVKPAQVEGSLNKDDSQKRRGRARKTGRPGM
jgi:excinuclease ABC subunit B